MDESCEFEVEGDLSELERVAEFMMDVARKAGLDSRQSFEVAMAVDEACTNIIQHAYKDTTGPIKITCEWGDQCLTVTIVDYGDPFDPTAVPEPDLTAPLEERQVGGLGVFFMRKLMDEVHFEFTDSEGNRLTMVKKVGAGSQPSGEDANSSSEAAGQEGA